MFATSAELRGHAGSSGEATPLIAMTKAEIVREAVEAGAPLEHPWSCYAGGERPCGGCDSCLLRAKGFAEAGLADPALAPP